MKGLLVAALAAGSLPCTEVSPRRVGVQSGYRGPATVVQEEIEHPVECVFVEHQTFIQAGSEGLPGRKTWTGGFGNDLGPVSVANGVLYAPSMSGTMYALDAASGKVLWSFQTPGAVVTGAVPVNGTVYWGDGYSRLGIPDWFGSTTFYAFSINGK